ncbi:hypothetical protein AAFF_G00054640 [Aldrovandia affinis]|uniref:StAR-related lipid transfer protein 7, mitochondrial n=1 Tax=Aldrovandia affinis TaxID=143900 RepID=A0AAD7S0U0_9TELE|nr:hypothetical protein AAFF_G00054640 [Aldrovandia affinis]
MYEGVTIIGDAFNNWCQTMHYHLVSNHSNGALSSGVQYSSFSTSKTVFFACSECCAKCIRSWSGVECCMCAIVQVCWELQAMEGVKNHGLSLETVAELREAGWEVVIQKKDFWVWKRPLQNSHLYEYRVLGTYSDITPRQFFNVQLDTEYRKKWDALVIKLEVVDRDVNTGSEIVHWATYFPYPLYSRDYVYVRRYDVDPVNNLMVLVSRAVEHPSIPETEEFVRVQSYQSKMVIRPHKSFDENGFDYLLTYSDDPQTVFPRYCVSWMVSSGMPDFLEKLHIAALRARSLEVGMQDYIGVIKTNDKTPAPNPDRLGGDSAHAGGPGQMYANRDILNVNKSSTVTSDCIVSLT